ncbi:hypothetical protein NCAS_0C03100 [Naumovozyma castellii]|uniref:Uncharacterized protein n=1 Tax=Naumovozyma castellii TaxID=27288 RepID=G0VCU0_NAUCA|nr:hypothetical protein NCAS_0C03100 [Naumovozyma castellii CBS 4309]CCC69300.1 hypothetical protein NCAS_0C03100 [Naumovozyma castellii CBS 4309]
MDTQQQTLAELIRQAKSNQTDINAVFASLSDVNRQVRIDVDDFCGILSNVTDLSRSQVQKEAQPHPKNA